jgi:peroxiredoxin Q/BCP
MIDQTHLRVGDQAPEISSVDQNGNEFSLQALQGQKVILYFYPKDDTPGCTKEACSFRDNWSKLQKQGYGVVGVSPDSARRHQNFINKYELPFTLIPDQEKEIINTYGVWGKKEFMGREITGVLRTTFVIDENGKIEHIITKVKTAQAANQVLDAQEA